MIIQDPFLQLIEQGMSADPSSIMRAVIDDAKVVLDSEPRPNMYFPHDYAEENFFEEYYTRCAFRLRGRLPSFAQEDKEVHKLIKQLALMKIFLIENTPDNYFHPGDLDIFREEVQIGMMEAKLKGQSQ